MHCSGHDCSIGDIWNTACVSCTWCGALKPVWRTRRPLATVAVEAQVTDAFLEPLRTTLLFSQCCALFLRSESVERRFWSAFMRQAVNVAWFPFTFALELTHACEWEWNTGKINRPLLFGSLNLASFNMKKELTFLNFTYISFLSSDLWREICRYCLFLRLK